jgi:hypothetical protein
MSVGLEEAKAALTKAKLDYSEYYNRRQTPDPTFNPEIESGWTLVTSK